MASDEPSDDFTARADQWLYHDGPHLESDMPTIEAAPLGELLRQEYERGRASLQRELEEAKRGDPDGHLLAVYQVLRGSAEPVAAELFEGGEPQYGRVVEAAKEAKARIAELEAGRAVRLFCKRCCASSVNMTKAIEDPCRESQTALIRDEMRRGKSG